MSSTQGASTRMKALFDNRWSGKNSSTATPWSAVGRRGMVQWAEDSRDSRCSAHPLLRRAAGAPHGAIAQRFRASGCQPEGCGFESRWSRSIGSGRSSLRRFAPSVGVPRIWFCGRPPARARCRTHLVQEGRTPRERSTCRRSSADREHLATNEGVGSSNLSDGVTVRVFREFLGGSVSGSAQGVVNP